MSNADLVFKEHIRRILDEGCYDENPRPKYKDGTPAHSIYLSQVLEKYDLSKGEFPITQLRHVAWKSAIKELLWIYQDQTSDLSVLRDKHGVEWWDDWNIGNDSIGLRYGATVNRYSLMDKLLKGLKEDPFGRRHIINLWQEQDFKETDGLLPCAFMTMWTVRKVKDEYYLDLTLTQRSSDMLVAAHVNMVQYVALQMIVAHECNMKVGKFVRFTQNLHIYDKHVQQARELLSREIPESNPVLILNAEGKSFYDITVDDFEMINYNPVKPQLKFDLGI